MDGFDPPIDLEELGQGDIGSGAGVGLGGGGGGGFGGGGGGGGDAEPTEDNPEDELDNQDDGEYPGVVTLSAPLVRYPDVSYLLLQENFALVTLEITVDQAPRIVDLSLTLSNDGVQVPVLIRKGETRAVVEMNGSGENLFGCTNRTISVVNSQGGGYSLLDTTATNSYEVCGYLGEIALTATTWTRADGEWLPDVDPDDWSWNGATEEWDYDGDIITDWGWDVETQEWVWEGEDQPINRPELPPPIPSSLPTEGAETTIVARAFTSLPPVPNGGNDLEIHINDLTVNGNNITAESKGTIVIPAVSPVVDGWRYNYSTELWDIVTLPSDGWRWDGSNWAWMGVGTATTAPTDTPPEEVPYLDWVNTRVSLGELTYHL